MADRPHARSLRSGLATPTPTRRWGVAASECVTHYIANSQLRGGGFGRTPKSAEVSLPSVGRHRTRLTCWFFHRELRAQPWRRLSLRRDGTAGERCLTPNGTVPTAPAQPPIACGGRHLSRARFSTSSRVECAVVRPDGNTQAEGPQLSRALASRQQALCNSMGSAT